MKTVDPSPEARAFASDAIQTHGAALQHFLRARIRNREDLGDLVNEVYLRLLRVPNVELVDLARVTPEDVRRVAKKYIIKDQSTTGWFVPETAE